MKISAMLLIFCFTLNTSAARAMFIETPREGVCFGPSGGLVSGEGSTAGAFTFEFTYGFQVLSFWPCAASADFRYLEIDGSPAYGPAFELSAFMGPIVGVGAGRFYGDNPGTVRTIFVGVPIPASEKFQWRFYESAVVLVEPYYRLNFFRGGRFHEFGVYIKLGLWNS